jgi:hypothetical protein
MDLLNTFNSKNMLDNFPKPNIYLTELNTIKTKITPILDDFSKYYVFYHMNPQIDENEKMFNNIKSNIEELYSSIMKISIDIDNNINAINTDYQTLNKQIEILKEQNTILKKQLGIAEDTYDGSDTMIDNYKDMYNLQYLKNFSLGLGIVFSLILITKMFKGQNPISISNPTIS